MAQAEGTHGMEGAESTDAQRWLAEAVASVGSSGTGPAVIDRLPTLPRTAPMVEFDGAEELGDFLAAVTAVAPRVLYADLVEYTEEDRDADLDRLADALEAGVEVPDADTVRADLDDLLGCWQQAHLLFLADGVAHRASLVDQGVHRRRLPVLVAEAAQRAAWRSTGSGFIDVAQARRQEREQFAPALDGLTDRLREDEDFLTGGTTEALRRQHAQRRVRETLGVEEIPQHLRGEVSAAAEQAWQWWRTTGRPAREAALLERVPELAAQLSPGTLEQRRRQAREVLTGVDALAVTSATVDALARARAGAGETTGQLLLG